jgi:hypothetical protein
MSLRGSSPTYAATLYFCNVLLARVDERDYIIREAYCRDITVWPPSPLYEAARDAS